MESAQVLAAPAAVSDAIAQLYFTKYGEKSLVSGESARWLCSYFSVSVGSNSGTPRLYHLALPIWLYQCVQ